MLRRTYCTAVRRRETLYTSYNVSFFSSWELSSFRRLFAAAFASLLLYTAAYVLPPLFHRSSLLGCVACALLLLLNAVHVHYMMIRSEHVGIPRLMPERGEFTRLVSEILDHEEFLKLKKVFHHTADLYDHVMRVAFISYSIAKVLSLDYKASARGGLLHDFFLYDWRERRASDASRGDHGREHPRIALENARTYFTVSEREADIILKHMFPKTWTVPRYLESAVVSLSDKIATVYEYGRHALCRIVCRAERNSRA